MHDTTFIFLIVALFLAVQGVAIAAFVLLRSRHGRLNLRGVLAAAGVVWIIPAVAGLGYITLQAAPHFRLPAADEAAVVHEQKMIEVEHAVADARESTDGVFVTHAVDAESAPAWVNVEADFVQEDDRVLRHIRSAQYATIEEAESVALQDAARIASRDLHKYAPYTVGWNVPAELVRNYAVRDRYIETVERDFGSITAPMFRVHLQVELSPRTREKYQAPWKAQLVRKRLTVMGSVVGLITVILVAAAAYLRLDAATHGAHRRGLQWAAASLVAAGTVTAGIVIQTV